MRAATLAPWLAAALTAWALPALAAPHVVASTKPIHSLVAGVMGDVGTPALLVKGAASPHTYSLRPSDAAELEAADIVFWTGHGMELFLGAALSSLAREAMTVELANTPGLSLLPVRQGGAFEPDGHAHGHGHDEADMHFWLDPANARVMTLAIAETLATADPDNAATYRANAEAQAMALEALVAELSSELAPVADRPFLVFHDAYQYFEQRFGLRIAGSVTVTPDVMPGAARLNDLRAKLVESGAQCVFAEPQFAPAVIGAITEGTSARTGILDPEGADLAEGPDLYPQLLRNLAQALVGCLAG